MPYTWRISYRYEQTPVGTVQYECADLLHGETHIGTIYNVEECAELVRLLNAASTRKAAQ